MDLYTRYIKTHDDKIHYNIGWIKFIISEAIYKYLEENKITIGQLARKMKMKKKNLEYILNEDNIDFEDIAEIMSCLKIEPVIEFKKFERIIEKYNGKNTN